ncbi:MAG: sigma-E factor negative regulatory protein RseC [Oceanicoccus sp.]|jgi:sigma-E factor negative regulatory protein RseC
MSASGQISEIGQVVEIGDDCLWVETIRKTTCQSCTAQKACGHGIMSNTDKGRTHKIRVLIDESDIKGYRVGDEVEISIPEHLLVTGALLVYLLPLLTMLGGAMLAAQVWAGDVPAVIGAVAGFSCGIFVVRYHAAQFNDSVAFNPSVTSLRKGSVDLIGRV